MRDKNIFYNIVRNEDDYTELFSNLLNNKLFRSFFCNFIKREKPALKVDFEYEDITTQYTTQKSGRPDIMIKNDDTLILIENKIEINTQLTRNQPCGYIDLIRREPEKSYKALIFILPRGYIHESQILRCHKKKKSDKYEFLIIYWEDLIQEIEKFGFPQISEIFKHFIDFSNTWFPLKEVVFSNNQIGMLTNSKTVIEIFQKLMDIVIFTYKELGKKEDIEVDKRIDEYEYAIYIKNSEKQCFFSFGIWYKFWEENNSPLCMAVRTDYPEETVTKFKQKFPAYVKVKEEEEEWFTIGLEDHLISNKDLTKKISDIISKTIDELK